MSQRSGSRLGSRRTSALSACLWTLTLLVSALPGLACPSAVMPGKSITLSSADGRSSSVSWLDKGRTRLEEVNPAAPKSFPRETVLSQGLLALDVKSPSARSRITYAPDAERVFPLAPGKEHEIAYTSEVEGRPPLKARMIIAVTEALQHKIGDCSYDALLVVRISEFENGQRTPVRYDVYVPSLQAILKSTMFDEANNAIVEQESFEFEKLAEK